MTIEKLTHKSILKAMFKDQMISVAEAKRIDVNLAGSINDPIHPLTGIAKSLPEHQQLGIKITLEYLCEWFAKQVDVPYFVIDPLKIDIGAVTQVVAPQYAKKHGILAVSSTPEFVTLAVKNPLDLSWRDDLENILRREVRVVFANPNDVERYISEFYTLAKSISQSTISDERAGVSIQQNLEQLVDLGRRGQLDAEDHHIVQLVDWLLQYAFEQRASDIHLEPRKTMGEIRFRIDGILHHAYQVPPNVLLAIIGRLKTLGRMDIAEKRRPLDGRLKTRTPDEKEIELRLSTIPTAMGEKLVMRIFDPEVLQRSFTQLGLNDTELATWHQLTAHTNGIILVTGPTGSGKTTTLYSTLKNLATSEVNVCTIEDPIEMVEPAFNQIQVHSAIDLDFAAGVKALLRQDPDIIMIGEIRDLKTAEMAIQAALTGHLVLSTLHTNDSPSAITRMLELGVPAYLINATVLGVLAQRLVRTLCPNCKEPDTVDPTVWQSFTKGIDVDLETPCKPVGCIECRQTGFLGRVGLYEMLEMSNSLKSKVKPDADLEILRQQTKDDGLRTLRYSGAKKVAEGFTTIEEVLRVTPFVA
ncbi:GspE/PulE family protein [Arenicella xantha]|uniref:General secretion pathway protein E n=1 Tax=Arenicella xantha TaxID=644221 RepID=A0A395JHI8_9GAMM|nr:GspE/PulE family protein [Arenicella xantha]RBP47099.1 general secretion pathway protein E [Arenicella xantha]